MGTNINLVLTLITETIVDCHSTSFYNLPYLMFNHVFIIIQQESSSFI